MTAESTAGVRPALVSCESVAVGWVVHLAIAGFIREGRQGR